MSSPSEKKDKVTIAELLAYIEKWKSVNRQSSEEQRSMYVEQVFEMAELVQQDMGRGSDEAGKVVGQLMNEQAFPVCISFPIVGVEGQTVEIPKGAKGLVMWFRLTYQILHESRPYHADMADVCALEVIDLTEGERLIMQPIFYSKKGDVAKGVGNSFRLPCYYDLVEETEETPLYGVIQLYRPTSNDDDEVPSEIAIATSPGPRKFDGSVKQSIVMDVKLGTLFEKGGSVLIRGRINPEDDMFYRVTGPTEVFVDMGKVGIEEFLMERERRAQLRGRNKDQKA